MSDTWTVDDQVAWVSSPDRVALLHLDRPGDLPVVLVGSSAAIWLAVDERGDLDGVVAEVAGHYEVNPAEIREQVVAFLTDLEQRHLIVRAK